MGKMNVAQFAGELGLPVELLLEQLQSAGVGKLKDSDAISEQDKAKLLEHLRSAHGASKNKITVVRRETTAIKKSDSTGKSRTIQVEVRKKRTIAPLTAQTEEIPAPESAAAAEPVVEEAAVVVGSGSSSSASQAQVGIERTATKSPRGRSSLASRTGGAPGGRCTGQARAQ